MVGIKVGNIEDKPYKVGDTLYIKGYELTVEDIDQAGKPVWVISGLPDNWEAEVDDGELWVYPPYEWWDKLHIAYLIDANFGERVVAFSNSKIVIIPAREWFIKEPDNILLVLEAPGEPNIDTTEYTEYVGVYNEDKGEWEWDETYCQSYPEICKKIPKPQYRDILIQSIKTGDYEDLYRHWASLAEED